MRAPATRARGSPRPEPVWRRYLRFFRPSVEGDVDDEIRFHFESRIEELVARGASPADARAQALEEFGDVNAVRQRLTEIGRRLQERRRRAEWWDGVLQDARIALRGLCRAPGLTATVVVTLALGIGANAAMFSLLDRIFFRAPAEVARPEEVRRLYWASPRLTGGPAAVPQFNYPMYSGIRAAVGHAAALTVYNIWPDSRLGRGGEARRVVAVYVGPDYFPFFGVRPAAGRFFAPDEERVESAPPVAVLAHDTWSRQFGGDAGILGRTIEIEKQRFTVVGVAPPGFRGVDLDAADVWLPLGALPLRPNGPWEWYRSRNYYGLQVLARIPARGDARRLAALATAGVRRGDPADAEVDTTATILTGPIVAARGPGSRQQEVAISTRLAGVAAIVLIIACANVTNLLLARGLRRRREIAVRVALGSSRAHLVRLLFAESALLTLLAAAVALAVGAGGGAALRALLLPGTHWAGGALDGRVAAFAGTVAFVTGLVAGLVPALRVSRPDLTNALKAGAREGVVQRSRLRAALVVVQAALSVVLLVGAGLFVRSLRNVRALDIGYDAQRLVFVEPTFDDVDPNEARRHEAQNAAALPAVAERLARVPGVERVAVATMTPMWGFGFLEIHVPDRDSLPPGLMTFTGVSPDYFAATGMRVLRGRAFRPEDRAGAPRVLVVNETMARSLWPAGDAIGRCVRFGKRSDPKRSSPCYTVVGVVQDTRLRDILEKEPTAQYYLPLAQLPDSNIVGLPVVIVRVPPARSAAAAAEGRRAVRELVPGAEPRVRRMAELLAPQLRPWRLGATLFSLFGALALAVAAVGVYGTIAYTTGQRTHEFGVRIALGARAADVLRLVIGDGVRVVAVGVLVGVALAVALARVVASLLYGVSPRDPGVMAAVALTLLAVAALACLIPAWRAAQVDPVEALRHE